MITGEPRYGSDPDARLQRAVAWSPAPPVPIGELPASLPAQLAYQGTVVDLTQAYAQIAQLIDTEAGTGDGSMPLEPVPLEPAGPPELRTATPELAARLHTDIDWQRVIDLLTDRQQIVLYGPPGTGKTFLAREIAAHLADSDAVRLVQFHPSRGPR